MSPIKAQPKLLVGKANPAINSFYRAYSAPCLMYIMNIPDPSGGRDVEGEVLDVLQTRAEDAAKENTELRAEVARLKREVDSEAVMFNMKVAELRNQFHRVEEQIRMKNAEIERLRVGDCDR